MEILEICWKPSTIVLNYWIKEMIRMIHSSQSFHSREINDSKKSNIGVLNKVERSAPRFTTSHTFVVDVGQSIQALGVILDFIVHAIRSISIHSTEWMRTNNQNKLANKTNKRINQLIIHFANLIWLILINTKNLKAPLISSNFVISTLSKTYHKTHTHIHIRKL